MGRPWSQKNKRLRRKATTGEPEGRISGTDGEPAANRAATGPGLAAVPYLWPPLCSQTEF